jgi:transposase
MTRKCRKNNQSRGQRHWQAHVTALQKSGLSCAEYCRQHQLSYHAATYWQRKLSKPINKGTTLVPVTFTPDTSKNPVSAVEAALKVVLPNKIAIEVSDDFSPVTLTRLLATLEKR